MKSHQLIHAHTNHHHHQGLFMYITFQIKQENNTLTSTLTKEEEEDDDDDDDDALMAKVNQSSTQPTKEYPPKAFKLDNDEPIALDDSDDEAPNEATNYQSDSEYSVDNRVIDDLEESEEEVEEESIQRNEPVKPHVLMARKLVKRSIRILSKKQALNKKLTEQSLSEAKVGKIEKSREIQKVSPKSEIQQKTKVKEVVEPQTEIESTKKVELMEVDETVLEKPEIETRQEKSKTIEQNGNSDKSEIEKPVKNDLPALEKAIAKAISESKTSIVNSNDSSRHESSLLAEISSSSIEEIFNRYVLKTTDQSPTLEEFSEELFYCLQQNKQELEKAQQLWNEKLHVKFKIRELMETIRRHRAVTEIETFGYKPENVNNNSHPMISSKSSTTTNSETDHYEKHNRMSSESVSRLIQDVRATMLKRDEKQRAEDLTATGESSFDNNSLASTWNNLQNANAQGRQGQIIDVQSIINDFRQKNPQEIPRRGRRMKNSFGGSFYENQNSLPEENRSFLSNASNNEYSNVVKNSAGYPEVSLHPVHNLYKNLSNSPGPSGGAHFSGQKSSLLQSILTKVRI